MVIGIGETVFDIIFKNDIPQAATPGGSTFNSVISLGRAGVDCCMVTECGDDYVGDITCRYLQANNVSTRYVNRHSGAKSHVSLAFLDEKNDAQYQFYKDHASVKLDECVPEFTEDDAVLFGSFFAVNPVIRTTVRDMLLSAREHGATIYYDVNFRKSHVNDIPLIIDNIRENMQFADVVRGSLEDFGYLYGTTDVESIYSKYIQPYCKVFICTNGADSIELRTPAVTTSYEVKKIETVSTVGAGDSFNAGFLYELQKQGWKGRDLVTLEKEKWSILIATGQRFSQNVCQQLGNSIDFIP